MKIRRILSLLLCLLLFIGLSPAALAETGFRCSPWAAEELSEAASLGFVPADLPGDRTQPITRRDYARVALNFVAELQYDFHVGTAFFAEAYCEAKGRKPAEPFADAPEEALTQARSIGLIQGRSETEYDPDSGITRQEAALILRRAYAAYADPAAVTGEADYADGARIAPWAKEGVDFVTAAGVMQGVGENTFDPLGAYTVEQCIVTFLRLYKSAPVSRAGGNAEPLLPPHKLRPLLVSQEMGGVPIQLERKTEAKGCTVLHCFYSGFTQNLEYLYVVFDDGGVYDALAALYPLGDPERYGKLGDLRSWSYGFTEDGSAITLHGEYATGETEDWLFRLDSCAYADRWTPYTPEPGEEAEELVKSCGVIIPRRLADTGVKLVGLLPPDPSGEDMLAQGEDGSVFIWDNLDDAGPEGKAIWQFTWSKTPEAVFFSRFSYCCVDERGVLWTGLRGGGLAPKLTGVVYGETYLSEGLAVTAEGKLVLWYGEEAPVCVLEDVDTARRWGSFVYAIKRDGSLWQLEGFGEEDRRILTDPQPTKLMESVREVSGPLALKEDGSVWRLTGEPAKVFDGAAAIQSNGRAFTAIRENGELWCWGTLHQPGNVQLTLTLDAPALCCEDVAQAACCYDCILILKTDGSLLTLRYEAGELQLFPVA